MDKPGSRAETETQTQRRKILIPREKGRVEWVGRLGSTQYTLWILLLFSR